MTDKFNTIVIDGDYLVYLCSFVTQSNKFTYFDADGDEIVTRKTVTACKKYIEDKGYDYESCTRDKVTTVHKNWESIAKNTAINKVNKWKKAVGASRVIIALGGPTNFRDRLPLFTKYKDRDASAKPIKLKEVRKIIESNFSCVFSDDCEADDIISAYQYKGHKDKSYIVCTEDKDAKQTPGYMYNPRTEEIRCCTGFGELELKTKVSPSGNKTYKIDGYGRSFFYYQVICGDPVDTYKAFSRVMTPLAFYNSFKDIKTDKEAWSFVANLYKEAYGDLTEWNANGVIVKGTWIDILQAYVDVVHMRRWLKPIDRLIVRDILKQYKII